MCGIAGGVNINTDSVDNMLDMIKHRGPDGRGINTLHNAVHGHVRLSLLDPTPASDQPFIYQGDLLTFTGEIWNYRELKKILEAEGYEFKTSGDTEVLAAWLHHWGIDGLKHLDGMFAFAWTSDKGETWIVRDAFGKVPLYVAKLSGQKILWASERKAFPSDCRPVAVKPGYALNINDIKWLNWYRIPERVKFECDDVLELLRLGVKKRLNADAPVCCLISGGLDSSLILALACEQSQDVTAFTAVYDKNSDDLKAARKLCSDFNVKLIEVSIAINHQAIHKAVRAIEIPSKAQIEIATLCLPLAGAISAEGFKACLSGEAADEIFGGYGNFAIKASQVKSTQELINLRREQLAKMARGNFVRCNKVFMAHGVECRLPFMEQILVEQCIQMDKQESPVGKKLLKQAAQGLVPRWVINRQKDTFQGASGASSAIAKMIASPVRYYNNELKQQLGYLPGD